MKMKIEEKMKMVSELNSKIEILENEMGIGVESLVSSINPYSLKPENLSTSLGF
jgi:hypothetical protein